MTPSWLGLFVTLTLPSSVSTIVPFVMTFCLARNLFEGVSRTFFISTFFFPTLIVLAINRTVFSFPPKVLRCFLLFFPSFTVLFCPAISNFFFFLFRVYFPPEIFLPAFILKTYGFYNPSSYFLSIPRGKYLSRKTYGFISLVQFPLFASWGNFYSVKPTVFIPRAIFFLCPREKLTYKKREKTV